ncbi:MAG: redoxin family protein, partial [Bdellovibrionia bacterium]
LLWAPCAGPILGLILTGAALRGASVGTTTLLFAYALGAATSLAAALAVGGKFLKILKKYLGADIWVRRALGTAVLLGVLAISLGWDRGVLTRLSRLETESFEQKLVQLFKVDEGGLGSDQNSLKSEGDFPDINHAAVEWLNSPPLTRESLQGKVVLVDFWTYSCINCLRSLPYVKAWAEKYKNAGLVVIGVHTPEFAFEKSLPNVKNAVSELGLTYPIAIDSNFNIWKAFHNSYWPAHYFIDAQGKIRHHHFGEGKYEESERVIQELLKEQNGASTEQGIVKVNGTGIHAKSKISDVVSPETYVGFRRAANFSSIPRIVRDQPQTYRLDTATDGALALNQWGLEGRWRVEAEDALLEKPHGKIIFRFHARDLHLVLGPGPGGKPVRFHVRLDENDPKESHGVDIDEAGNGVVEKHRLYQLIRQSESEPIGDRTFEIEFLDIGVQAFAFTFG